MGNPDDSKPTMHHHQPPPVYAPPYPAAFPSAPPPNPTVTVIAMPNLSHGPAQVTCPNCQHRVTTNVEYVVGSRTHGTAIVLCLICCCLPAIIPYCCTACQTAVHTCPRCGQSLGIHEP